MLGGAVGIGVLVVMAILKKFWKITLKPNTLRAVIFVLSGAVFYGITWLKGAPVFSVYGEAVAALTPAAFYHIVFPIVEKLIGGVSAMLYGSK